jgi:hypothetical protein
MPFDARTLAALIASDATTLWFYRTDDTRAAVLAPGYFAAAADRLAPGHVILAQTADSLSLLPVRQAAAVGNGLVLDVVGGPLRRSAAAALSVPVAVAAAATARALRVDAPPPGITEGLPFPVGASSWGAVSAVAFRLLNAANQVVQGPVVAPVSGGRAVASLIGPAPGSGYRIRAQDAADADARSTSASFTSVAPAQLATEGGEGMQGEGGEILLA